MLPLLVNSASGLLPSPPVKVSYILVYKELFVYSIQGNGGGENRRLLEFAFYMNTCVTQHTVVDMLMVHDKKVSDIVGQSSILAYPIYALYIGRAVSPSTLGEYPIYQHSRNVTLTV